MSVDLPHFQKGTHLSRFIEVLNRYEGELDMNTLSTILGILNERMGANRARLEATFPYTQLIQVMSRKEALLLMILSEGILVPIAVVSMIAAIKLGPVSLVATIAGTRPIFVLLYSTSLSVPGIRNF